MTDSRKESKKKGDEPGYLLMTYADGSTARLKVPAHAICEHAHIRKLCPVCSEVSEKEKP